MNQAAELRERIQHEVLLMDGAMGTYYSRLHPEMGEAEYANEEHPEWIMKIHKQYLQAGAQILRTNTFAVNHMLFAKEQIPVVLSGAVECARSAVEQYRKEEDTDRSIWIAASIGPIR